MKPYKNLGKRFENFGTGQLGTIVDATRKPGSRVWELKVQFDTEKDNFQSLWDSASFWRYNRIVADAYAPDHGPIPDRIQAILKRLEDGIPSKLHHITEIRIGKDSITYWKPTFQHQFSVSLWGGQGSWSAKHSDRDIALSTLKETLQGVMQTGVTK